MCKKCKVQDRFLLFSKVFLIIALCTVIPSIVCAATIEYSYDQAGRLSKVNYAGKKILNYQYDKAGNLLTRKIAVTNSKPGDVNIDGIIDLKDVILALQIMHDKIPEEYIFLGADVNGDDRIGQAEALYDLQKLDN